MSGWWQNLLGFAANSASILLLSWSRLFGQRVPPGHLGKSREVRIGGADLEAMLNRDGRQVRVRDEVSGDMVLADETTW